MIDLSKQSDQLEKWMDENIQRFLIEFPERSPITIGLYSSPANGWVSLCVDLTAKKPEFPGTNCPDFTHPEYALLEFPLWREEYEIDSPMIKRHDAAIVHFKHSQGDETFNHPFFDFLMRVINDYYHSKRDVFRPVWAGVQILDSRWRSFGRVYQTK
jgi:hypothetical protein